MKKILFILAIIGTPLCGAAYWLSNMANTGATIEMARAQIETAKAAQEAARAAQIASTGQLITGLILGAVVVLLLVTLILVGALYLRSQVHGRKSSTRSLESGASARLPAGADLSSLVALELLRELRQSRQPVQQQALYPGQATGVYIPPQEPMRDDDGGDLLLSDEWWGGGQ